MEAAVLYCGARRTAYCQELLETNGFRLTQICAAGEDSQMARMGILLSKNQLLLILGPEHNGEPTFGKPFFEHCTSLRWMKTLRAYWYCMGKDALAG